MIDNRSRNLTDIDDNGRRSNDSSTVPWKLSCVREKAQESFATAGKGGEGKGESDEAHRVSIMEHFDEISLRDRPSSSTTITTATTTTTTTMMMMRVRGKFQFAREYQTFR